MDTMTVLPTLITILIAAPTLVIVALRLMAEIQFRRGDRELRRERINEQRRPSIPAAVRAEIEQTPEWWDGRFAILMRQCFEPAPYVAAEHEGHAIVTTYRYGDSVGGPVAEHCTECPTVLVPRSSPRRPCQLPDSAPPCIGCKCGSA